MKYQIDQSIKIEDTRKTTYVCLTDGKKNVLASISAKEKRILKLYFRELQKPLIFKLFTFSSLCASALIKIKPKSVTINREYIGHERQIKSFILQIFRIEGEAEPDINFSEIGKGAPAHKLAYAAKTRSKIADILVIKSAIVLRYYEKTNKK